MDVRVGQSNLGTTLALRGELDDVGGEMLRGCVAATDPGSGAVIVDLREVSFIDSAGIWSLVAIHRDLGLNLRRLEVIGAYGQVRRALELSGVDNVLELAQ